MERRKDGRRGRKRKESGKDKLIDIRSQFILKNPYYTLTTASGTRDWKMTDPVPCTQGAHIQSRVFKPFVSWTPLASGKNLWPPLLNNLFKCKKINA